MRLLREFLENPWFDHFFKTLHDDQVKTLVQQILNFPLADSGSILTREQLLGEVRGVDWVRDRIYGAFAELQELTKSDPPI